MTIKTKLQLAFVILIILIIFLSTILGLSLYFQRVFFNKYVLQRDIISITTEISQLLTRQQQYIDYFMVLHEEREKDSCLSLIPQVKGLIEKLELLEQKSGLSQQYHQLVTVIETLFKEKVYEKKLKIIDTSLFPLYTELKTQIEEKNMFYTKSALNLQNRIFWLGIISFGSAGISILFSLFIVIFFGIKIYNSLITPLRILSSAAATLAKGEYKEISFSCEDEFKDVISVFNHMVKNLKVLQAQIIQMDRLSNIGQLAGGIAHELNNPLVGVLGQTQILLSKLSQEETQFRPHIEKIERAAYRCRETVLKLLQFSRQKEYEYSTEDINEVVKDTLMIADSELKAQNIEVVTMFNPNLPKIKISRPHIQQAFLNIINNAIQSIGMKKNKEYNLLQIKTYVTNFETGNTSKPYIGIEFQDTGVGIPKDILDLLFEPFFTTKDKTKFAGVGLAITKDIIFHHKGKITVFSDGVDRGAKFTIYLPLTEE